MRLSGLALAMLLASLTALSFPAAAQQGDAARGKTKAEQCFGCHGETGNSTMPNTPSLAGQPAAYTFLQLFLFREKLRNVPTMTPFVDGKSDEDLNDFAAYFAAQKLEPDPEPRW
jgi:cytochrome c553